MDFMAEYRTRSPPVQKGVLEDRPEERVVHRDEHAESAVATHEGCDRLDIRQVQRRIRWAFEEHHIKGAVCCGLIKTDTLIRVVR
jgi:hypothetical protein